MSSTERKNFLQNRTSTAEQRRSYRAARKAEHMAYWLSPEGLAYQEAVKKAHQEYIEALLQRKAELHP